MLAWPKAPCELHGYELAECYRARLDPDDFALWWRGAQDFTSGQARLL